MADIMTVVIIKNYEKFVYRPLGNHGVTKYITYVPKEKIQHSKNLNKQLGEFSLLEPSQSQASEVSENQNSPTAEDKYDQFDQFLNSCSEINSLIIASFCRKNDISFPEEFPLKTSIQSEDTDFPLDWERKGDDFN